MSGERFDGLLPFNEVPAFQESLLARAPRCIRLRPDRISCMPSSTCSRVVPWFSRGRFWTDSNIRPSQSLNYATADYYIQDAGSLLSLALLAPQPHEAICDLCAAPGGKASGIVESLGESGFLLANEPIGSRTAILRYALSRTGSPRYAVVQQDPDRLADRFESMFDAVLVDAPCSGQTMVGRGKRGENAFDPKQVEHSASRQRRILLAACRLLKPGGRLIYSTCTFAIEENEAQVRFLQNQFPGCFEPIIASQLEKWASPLETGCYRLWPHRDPSAGAFAAGLTMRTPVEGGGNPGRKRRASRPCRDLKNQRLISGSERLCEIGQFNGVHFVSTADGDTHGIAQDAPKEIVEQLETTELPRLSTGKSGVLKPDFTLAMLQSTWFTPERSIEIPQEMARAYLRGETLSLDAVAIAKNPPTGWGLVSTSTKSPWTVVRFQQKPLGWAKFAGNRFNNHLPSPAILAVGQDVESEEIES